MEPQGTASCCLRTCDHTCAKKNKEAGGDHTSVGVSGYISSVLTLLDMCPHTTICVLILLYVSSYYYVCCITLPDLEVSGSGEEALAAPSASVFVLLYQ